MGNFRGRAIYTTKGKRRKIINYAKTKNYERGIGTPFQANTLRFTMNTAVIGLNYYKLITYVQSRFTVAAPCRHGQNRAYRPYYFKSGPARKRQFN